MVLYADDVQFIHSGYPGQIDEMEHDIVQTPSKAQRWLAENSLKILPFKTESVLLSLRKGKISKEFKCNSEKKLCRASSAEILGFVLDRRSHLKSISLRWCSAVTLPYPVVPIFFVSCQK